jgi:hypothetical protein
LLKNPVGYTGFFPLSFTFYAEFSADAQSWAVASGYTNPVVELDDFKIVPKISHILGA